MQDFKVKKIQKFARYEFKYLLNKKLRKLIEEDIHHFMAYDGFVHPELDNSYFVRSLYFDNNLSSNFFEKVDGIKKRSKYRIRTYSKIDGTDIDDCTIEWINGSAEISKADIKTKMQDIETNGTAKDQKKASGKQKLKDLGLTDAEIKALTGA